MRSCNQQDFGERLFMEKKIIRPGTEKGDATPEKCCDVGRTNETHKLCEYLEVKREGKAACERNVHSGTGEAAWMTKVGKGARHRMFTRCDQSRPDQRKWRTRGKSPGI